MIFAKSLLLQGLHDIQEYILRRFETYGQTDGCLSHIHLFQLSFREESENGACRMDGQCPAVEEVGGTMHQFQPVEEMVAFLLGFEVDGEHRPRCRAKLLSGQLIKGVVL